MILLGRQSYSLLGSSLDLHSELCLDLLGGLGKSSHSSGLPLSLTRWESQTSGVADFMVASLWSGQATGQEEDSILCQELIGQLVLLGLKRKGGKQ